jgi:hypothetical protein
MGGPNDITRGKDGNFYIAEPLTEELALGREDLDALENTRVPLTGKHRTCRLSHAGEHFS